MSDYADFLSKKIVAVPKRGIEPAAMPSFMKPHQVDATAFTLRTGRAGNFLDTGMGKTVCELEFSRQAAEASNGMALIGTPLAVAKQIEREARKFGYDARVIRDQSEARPGINICNYDRFERLEPSAFGAVTLDESSILKDFSGATSRGLRDAFRDHRFRLTASATPAPNDHMELGQHAEFLGIMNSVEMLSKFFINDTSTASQQWRLKGHAEQAFWEWMASWACMAETPADFGHDASEYFLPPLEVIKHQTGARSDLPKDGLFAADANATNIFEIKRRTMKARAKLAAEVIFGELSEWTPNSSNTIGSGESNDACEPHRKNEPRRMQPGVSTTPTMQNFERASIGSLNSTTQETPTNTKTGSSKKHSGSSCKIIEPCSTSKMELVRYVEQGRPADTNTFSSITATEPAGSEDFSANDAISRSGTSGTILKTANAPLITSGSRMPIPWVLWCDTNEEQDILENEFGDAAISIRGSMSAEEKEDLHDAWLAGARPVLITKVSIFGYGVNWQHCCRMFFLGRAFSYERWYQAVRRCWRFGQTKAVHVHLAIAEGEDQIGRVIERKSADHIRMKRMMSAAMRRALGRESLTKVSYNPTHYAEIPQWLMAS